MPYKGHALPSPKDAEELVRAMPHIKALTIGYRGDDQVEESDWYTDDRDKDGDRKEHEILYKGREDLGPRFLRAFVRVHSEDSSLVSSVLINMTISCELLVRVLRNSKKTLRHVDLTAIELTGTSKKAAKWDAIFKVLLELDLTHLRLANLVVWGASEPVVMSSIPLKNEVRGEMRYTGKLFQGGSGTYTRWGASFGTATSRKALRSCLVW